MKMFKLFLNVKTLIIQITALIEIICQWHLSENLFFSPSCKTKFDFSTWHSLPSPLR